MSQQEVEIPAWDELSDETKYYVLAVLERELATVRAKNASQRLLQRQIAERVKEQVAAMASTPDGEALSAGAALGHSFASKLFDHDMSPTEMALLSAISFLEDDEDEGEDL